jgi:GNAT superfamily N-acetyltransferase
MSDDVFYVGGGEVVFHASDVRVLRLVRAIHRHFSPSTPEDIYRCIVYGTQNIVLPIRCDCDDVYVTSPISITKLKTMSLFDVHPGLLKFGIEEEGSSDDSFIVGDRQRAFKFPNSESARAMLPSLQASVTGENVVNAVVDFVTHNPSRILGICIEPCTLTNEDAFVALVDAESALFTIGRVEWHSIYEHVGKQTIVPLQTNIPVVQGKHVMICHLFYHHWYRVTPTCIAHHSVPNCYLHYRRYGFCNDIVVLDASSECVLWWMSDVSLKLNPRLDAIVFKREEPLVVIRPLKTPPIVLSSSNVSGITLPECKRQRTTVETWLKSANAPGLSAPVLVRYLDPPTHYTTSDGWCAQRITDMDECINCDSFLILSEEFGHVYARESLERAVADPLCGVYAAKETEDANATVVATFIMFIFEAMFVDGIGSAVMIDSFAVRHSLQGKGVGGNVFHKLCRGIATTFAEEDAYQRHVMFAQCLTSKRPKDFWFDKLDDSSIARALLLQASAIHASRVPIQTKCCARARIYYGHAGHSRSDS